MRIRLTLEYDGTAFHGWQVQESGPAAVRTVQGVLEQALAVLAGAPVRVAGASRTDEGVHARGQVAAFTWPSEARVPTEHLADALNANLPEDVGVRLAENVADDFHPIVHAQGKVYAYRIANGRQRPVLDRRACWHVRYPLDVERMREAAALLTGTHDFAAFATALSEIQAKRAEEGRRQLGTVRTITRIEIQARGRFDEPGGAILDMALEGNGFLYRMVRTIAGSLVEVGRGKQPPAWIAQVLAGKDRRAAGPTAPPQGLCLLRVLYD